MAHIHRVGINGLVPRRVESSNSAGEVSPAPISGFNLSRILRDTIIVRIYRLDEFLLAK